MKPSDSDSPRSDAKSPSEPPINTIKEILEQLTGWADWTQDMDGTFVRVNWDDSPVLAKATQAIERLITQARIEAVANARKRFYQEQLTPYYVGDIASDYKILDILEKGSIKNRKFRVECIWCKSVMSRYSNKFKAKHKFCNNWRNENNRLKDSE